MLTEKRNYERPGYRLHERSQAYSLEEARELDTRPRKTRKTCTNPKRSRVEKTGVLAWCLFWGMFSLPGFMLFAGPQQWGIIHVILAGFLVTVVGRAWGTACPFRNYILKWGPGLVGVMLIINGLISLVVPPIILFIAALILTPFGIGRYYAEEA